MLYMMYLWATGDGVIKAHKEARLERKWGSIYFSGAETCAVGL